MSVSQYFERRRGTSIAGAADYSLSRTGGLAFSRFPPASASPPLFHGIGSGSDGYADIGGGARASAGEIWGCRGISGDFSLSFASAFGFHDYDCCALRRDGEPSGCRACLI